MNVRSLQIVRVLWQPWLTLLCGALAVLALYSPGIIFSAFSAARHGAIGMASVRDSKHMFIFGGVLYFACGLGLGLAAAFHQPFHGTFGMLLPSARTRLIAWHIGVMLALAAVATAAAHWVQPDVLPTAFFGVTVGIMSLWVPVEPEMRWQGSRLAFLAVLGVLLLTSFHVWELRTFLIGSPFIAGAAGLAVALCCFALGYSRERLRERAMIPWTRLWGDLNVREAGARRRKKYPMEHSATSVEADLDDPFPPADGSTWSRIRLVFYGYYGKGWWRGRHIFLVPLAVLPIAAAAGYFIGAIVSSGSYAHRFNLAAQLAAQRHANLQSLTWLMIGGIFPFSYAVWPKMDAIYPFSRRERFRIVALWSVVLELLALANLFLGVWGEAWGQSIAKNNFDVRLVMETGLLLALIISPVTLWGALYRSRKRTHIAQVLYLVSWTAVIAMVSMSDLPFLAAIFSPVGLLVAATLAASLHFAYYASLRRVCLKADLVFRSS